MRFDKSKFSKGAVRDWIQKRGYLAPKIDASTNQWLVRQMSPDKFEKDTYITLSLGKGVSAVMARRHLMRTPRAKMKSERAIFVLTQIAKKGLKQTLGEELRKNATNQALRGLADVLTGKSTSKDARFLIKAASEEEGKRVGGKFIADIYVGINLPALRKAAQEQKIGDTNSGQLELGKLLIAQGEKGPAAISKKIARFYKDVYGKALTGARIKKLQRELKGILTPELTADEELMKKAMPQYYALNKSDQKAVRDVAKLIAERAEVLILQNPAAFSDLVGM